MLSANPGDSENAVAKPSSASGARSGRSPASRCPRRRAGLAGQDVDRRQLARRFEAARESTPSDSTQIFTPTPVTRVSRAPCRPRAPRRPRSGSRPAAVVGSFSSASSSCASSRSPWRAWTPGAPSAGSSRGGERRRRPRATRPTSRQLGDGLARAAIGTAARSDACGLRHGPHLDARPPQSVEQAGGHGVDAPCRPPCDPRKRRPRPS